MELLDVKYYPDKDYRELFNVNIDSLTCEYTAVVLTKDEKLLLLDSKLKNNSSAYWEEREFFSIDKEEFSGFLEQAKSNGYIEQAIKKAQTTEEELDKLMLIFQ